MKFGGGGWGVAFERACPRLSVRLSLPRAPSSERGKEGARNTEE